MRNWGKISMLFLCCLFALMTVGSCNAGQGAEEEENVWMVPFLGKTVSPAGFRAVDLELWIKEISKLDGKVIAGQTAEKPGDKKATDSQTESLKKFQLPPQVKLYQLQVDEGTVFHEAYAVIFQDKSASPQLPLYFGNVLSVEQEVKLQELNKKIPEAVDIFRQEIEKSGWMSVRYMDLQPVERIQGSQEVIYSMSGRIGLDMKGLVLSLNGKGFLFEREAKPVILMIFTHDVDGAFWNRLSDQMVASFQGK